MMTPKEIKLVENMLETTKSIRCVDIRHDVMELGYKLYNLSDNHVTIIDVNGMFQTFLNKKYVGLGRKFLK
jgi:hypothetical protein